MKDWNGLSFVKPSNPHHCSTMLNTLILNSITQMRMNPHSTRIALFLFINNGVQKIHQRYPPPNYTTEWAVSIHPHRIIIAILSSSITLIQVNSQVMRPYEWSGEWFILWMKTQSISNQITHSVESNRHTVSSYCMCDLLYLHLWTAWQFHSPSTTTGNTNAYNLLILLNCEYG